MQGNAAPDERRCRNQLRGYTTLDVARTTTVESSILHDALERRH